MSGDVDLIAFITARLDEDELWAKAASAPRWPEDGKQTVPGGVHWTWAVGDNWDPVDPDPLEPYMGGYGGEWSQQVVLRTVEEWDGSVGPLPIKIAESEELRTADGAHVVRHDPAQVLRDVAGKRRIVALAQTLARFDETHPNPFYVGFGESLLRALAHAWSEHPDYRQEWTP